MRKFHFSLAPLMRVRERAVRDSELRLAQACEERRKWEEARRRKEEELLGSIVGGAPRGTQVQVRQLLEADAERRRLRSLLQRAEENVARSEAELVEKRARLLDARRDEKVVGKLREKRYSEYALELTRSEQKTTDEVAGRRHGRKTQ